MATEEMPDPDTPLVEGDEASAEYHRKWAESEAARHKEEAEIIERDAEAARAPEDEHVAELIEDHNARVDAAHDIDWDAWEAETGLTRPEIPKKLK